MYIYPINFITAKNRDFQNNKKTLLTNVKNNSYTTNIYYTPVFTSKRMTDKEFKEKLAIIEQELRKSEPKNDNNTALLTALPSTEEVLKHLNKNTINCAEKIIEYYPFANLNKEFLPKTIMKINDDNVAVANMLLPDDIDTIMSWEIIDIIEKVTKDNSEFAKVLCRDLEFQRKEIPGTLAGCTKETLPFAKAVYIKAPEVLYETMSAFISNDRLRAANQFIAQCKEKNCNFPSEELKLIKPKLNKKEIEVIEAFYNKNPFGYSDNKLIAQIIRSVNSSNFPLFKHAIDNPERFIKGGTIDSILKITAKHNLNFAINLYDNKKYNAYSMVSPLSLSFDYPEAQNIIEYMYDNNTISDETIAQFFNTAPPDIFELIEEKGIDNCTNKAIRIKNICYKYPEQFINGNDQDLNIITEDLDYFFDNNFHKLIVAASVLDSETLDVLMHKRLAVAGEYLNDIYDFPVEDLKLLEKLINCKNSDNEPFSPGQKLEFITLLKAYNDNILMTSFIKNNISDGKVNLENIKLNLFRSVLLSAGITPDEIKKIPYDKITKWDIDNIHYLADEISKTDEKRNILNIIKAASFREFEEYLHDNNELYGQTNIATKNKMKRYGLSYEKWLHPSKSCEVKFVTRDLNKERLKQLSELFIFDVEELRKTKLKGFIDKRFKDNLDDGKFYIPENIIANKAKLLDFTDNFISTLSKAWERAKINQNSTDPLISQKAKNTLTILDHLNQRNLNILTTKESETEKPVNLTIKMWDRIPQKDLFQGNYSTCCIGLGNINASAITDYLNNTAFNMIEIVDNNTGKTIGNALCYFTEEDNGKPALIIDNIEINNSYKFSETNSILLRKAITEYASNILKEVSGKNNLHIYLGRNYNDVPCSDLPLVKQPVSFIGELKENTYYVDLYGGWTYHNVLYDADLSMYKLK